SLAVAYSSAGVCTNVGATFMMTSGSGTCTVKYDQPVDSNYNAATQATESVIAQKANQTITVNTHAPASATYNTNFTVAATANSRSEERRVGKECSTKGAAYFNKNSGTGACTVKYEQTGDSKY